MTPDKFHLPKQLTENSFQWFHLNFKKAQVNNSPGEAHSQNTKKSVCYHSSPPKVSCKYESSRNSEVIVLSEDQNIFLKRNSGPPGLVSEESYFKPHLTHTNVTLQMLLREQEYVHKGKQAWHLPLKLYLFMLKNTYLLLTLKKKYKQHDMYFTSYFSSLIDNIHRVLATQ